MKRKPKEILLRILILLAGLTIAHFGVTLFLLASMGSDPFNVLIQGIFRTLQQLPMFHWLTHGIVHMSICFLIILILIFADRSYIKIGTILCMVCGGPIIDFFTGILVPILPEELNLVMKIFMQILGCVILAYGMTVVIKSDAGTGPNDLVAVVISDKSGKKFSAVRIFVDLSFVIAGFFLGGSVGIGTIICAACVGPVAGCFLPVNEKIIHSIIRKVSK